jgi:predicted RNase H-like HicB family nuclease
MNKYSFQLHWSESDALYIASCPEVVGVSGFGATPDQALLQVRIALELAIGAYAKQGLPPPPPRKLEQHSGQLRLRMPRTIHSALSARAEDEGVSLNSLAIAYLSEALGSASSSQRTTARLQAVLEELRQYAADSPSLGSISSQRLAKNNGDAAAGEVESQPGSLKEGEDRMTEAATDGAEIGADATGPSPLEGLVENIAIFVRGGLSPEDAAKRLSTWTPEDQVKAALAEYRNRTGRIRSLRDPGAIVDDQLESWYIGPQDGDKFWPALEKHLRAKGRSDEGIKSLDAASTKVVSVLQPPGVAVKTRGLVVGYVQSGKTENFSAVISKAADVGYRFFIVLSGMNNALRNQTQDRLNKDIVALNLDEWITLTDATHDFRATTNVNAFLTDKQSLKILGVVKKHKGRLARLLKWLQSARPEVLQNCPVLVIDDEADQASPNSAKELADRTEINKHLIDILKTLPKAAYVGYTATPFANLLIDPLPVDDLYPRDFIVDLPRPDTYFGPERIFGREPLDWEEPDEGADGLDMVRSVPEAEVLLLRPPGRDREDFYPSLTPSLRTALHYFLLTAAARRVRGQTQYHCSMLLHTTEYTIIHDRFKRPLEDELVAVRTALAASDKSLLSELRELWSNEQAAVPSESVDCIPVLFDDLLPQLSGVLQEVQVKLEHGKSTDRIVYPEVDPLTPGKLYVVVGGNVLSRGLTIEGLTVSFFLRSASAYDTLLQMGRWFGYRPGYADLPRLWMTDELKSYFYHLAIVEREIRYDIDKYKNGRITPLEFGVRIRKHPFLAITSKLKMQKHVTAQMSFSGQAPQTLVFRHKDVAWLDRNVGAAKRLLAAIRARDIEPVKLQDRPHLIFQDVPSEDVLAFLHDYVIHESHDEMQAKLLRQYIEAENKNKEPRLRNWNVAVVTRNGPRWGTIDFGLQEEIPLINRARHKRNLQFADVKALMSALDIGVDVDRPNSELKTLKRPDLQKLRDALVPDRGLLLLYPINKDSIPLNKTADDQKKGERMPLNADAHVIGLALVFPSVDDAAALEYVTADLSGIERDDIEDVEDVDE